MSCEVVVGPSGINNRYTFVRVERKPLSSKVDGLIGKLKVARLAKENLVSPFASDMLDISRPGLEPINPRTSLRTSIPAGDNQSRMFSSIFRPA